MDHKILLSIDVWIVLFIFIFLIYIITLITRQSLNKIENFTQNNNDEDITNVKNIYDDFYSSLYDSLVYNFHRNEYESEIALNIVSQIQANKKNGKINILQTGCGTGNMLKTLVQKVSVKKDTQINLVGADISRAMINNAAKNGPPNIDFKCLDITTSSSFPPNSYDAVFCLYFTFYYLTPQQQVNFLQNVYSWLVRGGKFILHLVDKDNFDPLLPVSNPISIFNPQHYTKKRIMQSKVSFNNGMDYVATFIPSKNENEPSLFNEKFKSGKTRRSQSHQLYFTTEKSVVSMCQRIGFSLENKYDMIKCGYEHQYLILFTKE